MILESLSFTDFEQSYQKGQRSFVYLTMIADAFTPMHVIQALENEMQDCVMLESGLLDADTGRYSFIGFDTMAALTVNKQMAAIVLDNKPVAQHRNVSDPMQLLRELTTSLHCIVPLAVKKYVSSAIGFVCYEVVQYFTDFGPYAIEQDQVDANFPTIQFNFYRQFIVFDHQQEKLMIGQFVKCDGLAMLEYQAGMKQIQNVINVISKVMPNTHANVLKLAASSCSSSNLDHQQKKMQIAKTVGQSFSSGTETTTVDIDDETFMVKVARAKTYVQQGDAFQIVLSRTFAKPCTAKPIQVYRALRSLSPAPFMFYMPHGRHTLMGVSPERLISVYDKQVTINPIAGTRRRNDHLHNDVIAQDLLDDSKENAEHMMLVDLARNDIGCVVKPGSIKIKKLKEVKHYSHVSHLVSEITGELRDDVDALDALKVAFPAGTLSGAPKIRAMNIIAKLEGQPRGLYGGVICRLDYDGNLDTCIVIRTAILTDGIAAIRTGCGVVYDSDPQREADETYAKAYSLLYAITAANQGAL